MSTIRFEAKITRPDATEQVEARGQITLPESASAKLPSQATTMVEGVISGFPFRAALESDGDGGHRLLISKAIHDAAGADASRAVTVEIMRVGDEPETRVPADVRNALNAAPPAQEPWEDTTPLARRDWILWITTAKKPETRARRIEKGCDMLASGKRRVCCFPGLKWLTKEHVTPDETWLPLPKS